MGRRALAILVCLVVLSRAQDTYHEALLEYFEQAERLEQGSGEGPGGMEEDAEEEMVLPTRIVRCLRCEMEESPDTCNPRDLRRDLHEFIVECTGRCLNISGGESPVYGCADERHGRTDRCITRANIQICTCSSDLCNGPKELFEEEEEDGYFEIDTKSPYMNEITPQHSHENSCSPVFVSLHILSLSMFTTLFQNMNLRFRFV